jgi:tRNA:m4X modification enzyme
LKYNKLQDSYIQSIIPTKTEAQRKHLDQISSIISHVNHQLTTKSPPNESVCLVELGAGRGKLSYWFNESFKNSKNEKKISISLIERGAQRFKFDTLMKNDIENHFDRVRIDLRHVFLNKLPLVTKSDSFLLYGKHLCGVATDYAIRSIKNSIKYDKKLIGLVLALCCHHQCVYDSFCGKEFLNRIGIDKRLFSIIKSLTSWAVCKDYSQFENEKSKKKFCSIFFFQNHFIDIQSKKRRYFRWL